ncbi:BQ5605_C040g11849 [Microbotryum silenes-dioicae]|uniref:BQ5605_C040g11849 protein n=1 Tax=Microbotryum silenes-dioicae TaxID=796604 RepID=A0A2X0NC83_9BASI|nr:BQ5605_C040g11849 [Microbotryum silenes-dioicae]
MRGSSQAALGDGRPATDLAAMSFLDRRLTAALKSRRDRSMLRTLEPLSSGTSSTQANSGTSPRSLMDPASDPGPSRPPPIDFSSNDYLSFGRSSLLRQNFLRAIQAFHPSPYGPPASRLLDGNSPLHLDFEARLSTFFRGESALLFNSGFDANVGLWMCLPAADDYIVYDELVHASVHDGMKASRCPKQRRRAFRHNSVGDLRNVLRAIVGEDPKVQQGTRNVWIGVETLYSMDGDLAPLKEIVMAVEEELPKMNGQIIVDEAHSTGLYGPQGRGIVCALGLANRIAVRLHTFGKAMACSGAVVLASSLIRSYLINYARPLIYSTAMPYMNVIAMREAIDMLDSGKGDLAANRVHSLSTMLLNQLSTFLSPTSFPISLPSTLNLSPAPPPPMDPTTSPMATTLVPLVTTSPIIPLLTDSPRRLSLHLIERGFLVRPLVHPTVPKGMERVRVCLHAGNTKQEVRDLAATIQTWAYDERQKKTEQHL